MQLHRLFSCLSLVLWLGAPHVQAHDLSGDEDHPHYDWSVRPPDKVIITRDKVHEILQMAQADKSAPPARFKMPASARPFSMFLDRLKLHWDNSFLYVESNGLPKHNMMIGITAWQQQVPIPQSYFGSNAWTIPLHPSPSSNPVSIKGRFLRGAIALAANGIPIFNPQNNRGEISQEIGELDQWGGHCGRADDYHYHAAPLHLQAIVGKDQPIAYALDGYAIYGLTEPDGSIPVGLDAFDGHSSPALGYHYHASKKYPYVNGGFHGQVTEREGQVDPQPRAQPIRPALPSLKGATITGYTASPDGKVCSLRYSLDGQTNSVNYSQVSNGVWKFQYLSSDGSKTEETYRAGDGLRPEGGQGPGGRFGGGPGGRLDGGPERGPENRPAGGPGDGPARDRGPGLGPAEDRPDGGQGSEPGDNRLERRQGEGADRGLGASPEGTSEPVRSYGTTLAQALPNDRPSEPRRGGALLSQRQSGSFALRSSVVVDGAELQKEFTGDGKGLSPPLEWDGAPQGTKSFAISMHHIDREGRTKWYWTLYNIPANIHALPENVKGVGTPGSNSINREIGYAPPHSKGPGAKTYTITLYALSASLQINLPPSQVNRDVLLTAMKGKMLASSELHVVSTRVAQPGDHPPGPEGREQGPGPEQRPESPHKAQ